MSLLDDIKKILSFQDWREASTAPGWRGRTPRMRKSRTPFHGRARRETPPQTMTVEKFRDKDARDARFAELRARGTQNVSKFSDVERVQGAWRSVWCVVRP